MVIRNRLELRHRDNVPLYKIISARIKDYLQQHDMTASELARNADVTKMALSQYINEKRHRPEATTLEKINKAMFRVDLSNRLIQFGAGEMELKLLTRKQRKELETLATDQNFVPEALDTTLPLPREQVRRQQKQRKVTARDMQKIKNNFTRNVNAWMDCTGKTQTDVGKLTGMSQQAIGHITRGAEPRISNALAIASVIGISLDRLLTEDLSKKLFG